MLTKICATCKQDKNIDAFNRNKQTKDGYQRQCRKCHKKYKDNHYLDNKEKYIEKAKRNKKKALAKALEWKSQFQCSRCSENHIATLEFHHLDPTQKDLEVSTAIYRGWGLDAIKKEADKCIVLCSNCHKKLHYEQKQ